ncbi:MAG: ATP-binding protein [Daejeonella sp.]
MVKRKKSDELIIANKELAFQNNEKEKRAAELSIANIELAYQNDEKEKRAAELIIANKELVFQNDEKEKRAAELIIANKELAFQNEEKEKRAEELIIANEKLNKSAELLQKNLKEIFYYKYALDESSIIAFTDQKGIIKKVNNNFCKITKHSEEELIGQDHRIINSGYHTKEFIRDLWVTIAKGKIWKGQLKNKAKDGSFYWVDTTIVPFLDEQGKPYQYLAIRVDITDRKEAEEYLIQRTAQLETANKELVFQNEEKEKRAAELVIANEELAFQNDEKEKRAADLIILSEVLKVQKEELRLANEELYEKAQLLLRQEEKLIRINEDLLYLNQDLENRVFERTCELENLNHELKDLNLSKDKFLSIISHDLRNPLTALLISSNKLRLDTENPVFNGIQPLVKIIHSTSNKILQQLNELLEWAKLQKDKTSINPEKLHLVRAVDQSLDLLKANALQKNIVLENEVPFDLYVNADTLMFRSILQNLVTNAIKYTPHVGLIKITAQRIDKMVEVCVMDSGIGMEEHTRENLFTNSASIQLSGTNNEKGSGLGLILVKDFVTQHGGTIRIESERGKGTCIIFTVPEY